uniref:Uncharacterized protein n=1 Tax=Fagus sylvatica TaxID=28930 RepID=A0A2N9F0X6_FAGSY
MGSGTGRAKTVPFKVNLKLKYLLQNLLSHSISLLCNAARSLSLHRRSISVTKPPVLPFSLPPLSATGYGMEGLRIAYFLLDLFSTDLFSALDSISWI